MKKILAVMMTFILALSLVACGGGAEQTSEFTPEQQALAKEFSDMVDRFNDVVDKVNASPTLLEEQELVDQMNELSAEISAADEKFASPKTLTPEVMTWLKTAIEATHTFIKEAEALLDEIEKLESNSGGKAVIVPVEIFNNTGMEIHTLALSPANTKEWGENLIVEVIKDGEMVLAEITFTKDTLVWDILIQDGGETQVTFMGLDFSEANSDGAKLVLELTEGREYIASVY